jgi:hypothetical protein
MFDEMRGTRLKVPRRRKRHEACSCDGIKRAYLAPLTNVEIEEVLLRAAKRLDLPESSVQ